jgi:hypothetical protein
VRVTVLVTRNRQQFNDIGRALVVGTPLALCEGQNHRATPHQFGGDR